MILGYCVRNRLDQLLAKGWQTRGKGNSWLPLDAVKSIGCEPATYDKPGEAQQVADALGGHVCPIICG